MLFQKLAALFALMVFASHSVIGHPYPVGPSPEGIPNSVFEGAGGIGIPHPVGPSPEGIANSVTGGAGGIGNTDSVGRGPESVPDSVTRDVGKLAAEIADPAPLEVRATTDAQATALTQVLVDIVGPKLAPDVTQLVLALAKSGILPRVQKLIPNIIKILPTISKQLPNLIKPLSKILANAASAS